MDQRQTGGEWGFELKKFRRLDALTGEIDEKIVIILINPNSPWNVKVGVFKKGSRFTMTRVFVTPYAHRGEGVVRKGYGKANEDAVKNLPREAKRAIRRAFPLAVLML